MAQKIKKESNKELLALGEEQVKIEVKEKQRKKLTIPIILTIVGAILMLIGTFYNNIVEFLNTNLNKNNKEETIKDSNILKCSGKVEDETLGLITKTDYTFIFKDKKLQNLNEVRTIEPMEYSDIGPNNVRVISGKYMDLIGKLTNIDGLKVNQNLNDNKLSVNINVDLKVIDIKKISKNDKIQVIYTLNESSKSVKQKLANSGDILCE